MSSLAVGRTAVPFFFPSRSDGVATPRRNAETSMRTQKTRLRTEGARWIAWHHRTRSIEFLFGRNRDPFSSPPTPHPPKRQPNFNSSSIHERHCNCSITSILFFFFFIPWFIRAIMIACWQVESFSFFFIFYFWLFQIELNRGKKKNQDLLLTSYFRIILLNRLYIHMFCMDTSARNTCYSYHQSLIIASIHLLEWNLTTSNQSNSYLRPLQFLVDNFCEIIIKLYRRW